MPDLKSIPDDVKWRLAADCAARLPALYDVAFRKVLGENMMRLSGRSGSNFPAGP